MSPDFYTEIMYSTPQSNHCLILVLAEYTECFPCRGRVPVATVPSKDQDGADTALTEMYFSQLGTALCGPL